MCACALVGRAVRVSRRGALGGPLHGQRTGERLQHLHAGVAYRDPPASQRESSTDETLSDVEIPDGLPRDFSKAVSEEFASREAAGPTTASAPVAITTPASNLPGSDTGSNIKGLLLLNLGALLFGSNQVVIKTTEEVLSPVALDAWRFGAAALCFLPLLPRALKQRHMLRPALELGVWLTAGYTAQAFGLSMTSASHGAFTGTFTVLAVPLLVGLSGRRIAGRTWAAGAAALLGVSLLTTSEGAPNWGDAVCVLSAVLFGVHKWRSESVTASIEDTSGLVALQLAVLAASSIALALPEIVGVAGGAGGVGGVASAAAGLPWAEIAFMGIGTTALTLWIEMAALKDVSAPLAALIYSAEPLWGAAFAWVLLSERWGAQGWVGAALIVAASLASQLGGDVAEKAEKEKVA